MLFHVVTMKLATFKNEDSGVFHNVLLVLSLFFCCCWYYRKLRNEQTSSDHYVGMLHIYIMVYFVHNLFSDVEHVELEVTYPDLVA